MRVLQINAVINKGSTGTIARDICKAVSRYGGEGFFASQENAQAYNEFTVGKPIDYKLHALFSRITGLQGYASKASTRTLLCWIEQIQPDIIHIHNIHNNYIHLPMLFTFIAEKKIHTVVTLHDSWMLTGKCMHFLKYGCSKWKTGCCSCPAQKKEIPSLFVDNSHKVWSDRKKYIGENPYVRIVGCSEWITHAALESVLKERVVGTIHNGVDLEVFRPTKNTIRQELSISDNYVILGMANKWLAPENEETYRAFIPQLREDEILVLVGCSLEQIKKLPAKVIGIPFVTEKTRLAQCYSMADVFVNTTKVDTFPTVNLEALACGIPVVTYDSGGASETIDSKTGYTVPYGDVQKLRESIDHLKNIDRQKQKGNCIDRAKRYFDCTRCYDDYISLYRRILCE